MYRIRSTNPETGHSTIVAGALYETKTEAAKAKTLLSTVENFGRVLTPLLVFTIEEV